MFIIVYRNDWNNLSIVINCCNTAKEFECESEAFDYAHAKGLFNFQVIEVTI